MKQFGKASVWGLDGTLKFSGDAAVSEAFPESIETSDSAQVSELKDGFGELIGFSVSDERDVFEMTIIPKAASVNGALHVLKFIAIPSTIVFTPVVTSGRETDTASGTSGGNTVAANELYGASGGANPGASHNTYIYSGGARRTHVRGQSALRLTCYRPRTTPLTTTALTTQVT